MDKANTSHYKALLRVIKCIIVTRDYCYQMQLAGNTNGPWEPRGYNDADYAGDNNTWEITTIYIVLINGSVIAWNLLSQKTVKLSIYRILIFSNHGIMLRNTICTCNFIVYRNYFWMHYYHACRYHLRYITIGSHIVIPTDKAHKRV